MAMPVPTQATDAADIDECDTGGVVSGENEKLTLG